MLLEHIQIAKDIVIDYHDLTDECESISEAYAIGFRELGYNTKFIIGNFNANNGKGHCWLEVDGIPIDLTVSQFGDFKIGIIEENFYNINYQIKMVCNGEDFEPIEDEDEALELDWNSSFYHLNEFRIRTKIMKDIR